MESCEFQAGIAALWASVLMEPVRVSTAMELTKNA